MRSTLLLPILAAAIAAAPVAADVDIPVTGFCTNPNSITQALANAVTDRIYVHCGSTLVEIDAATHAQRSIALTGRLRIVDPIRNRVIAAPTVVGGSLEVLDVPSWTVTPIASGLVTNLALDPIDGALSRSRSRRSCGGRAGSGNAPRPDRARRSAMRGAGGSCRRASRTRPVNVARIRSKARRSAESAYSTHPPRHGRRHARSLALGSCAPLLRPLCALV